MKKIVGIERNINVMKLYDMLINYLYFKNYPKRIQKDMNKLYSDVLQYMKDEEDNEDELDINNIKFYYYEKAESGKECKFEIDEEYFLLDELLSSYMEDKYPSFSEKVLRKIEELRKELQKELPSYKINFEKNDDVLDFGYIEEFEYEEPIDE